MTLLVVRLLYSRGTTTLKRSAEFGRDQLMLADGSVALDRVDAASIRFPKPLGGPEVDLTYAKNYSWFLSRRRCRCCVHAG